MVIGVHTPEFSVEKQLENVRWSVNDLRVPYPIAVDNDYKIWRAFSNNYWPAVYLIDARGRVRYHHFGEGGYEETEKMIQLLLAEANGGPVAKGLVSVEGEGAEAAADLGEPAVAGELSGIPAVPGLLVAGWIGRERGARVHGAGEAAGSTSGRSRATGRRERSRCVLNQAGGRIVYRFHARDVNLVMGPATLGKPVRFRVLVDGAPPGAGHGVDVDADGNGIAKEQRMYQLIRQTVPIVDRTFEIEFLDAGCTRTRVHVRLNGGYAAA